jgi:membrane protease YdiL (CAAX protease family)
MTPMVEISAGGSLPRDLDVAVPSLARRARLWLEMAIIFIGAPFAVVYLVYGLRLPLLFVLPPLMLILIAYMLWDSTFQLRRELARGFSTGQLVGILLMFAVIGAAITYAAMIVHPRGFLSFPRNAPRLWLLIMILYPLLSVAAQELVYRTFFFHRYGPLFGGWRWVAILFNAVLFGFGHIILLNWIAVTGTFLIGLVFAYRYDATRSFWAVWLEHSLYGCLVFTVGLGRYFYTGIPI